MTTLRITPLGAATAILEIGGVRLLTDPALDHPGTRYTIWPGLSSSKLTEPALGPEQLGRIDAVLLTHDHHFDNLDERGRSVLPQAGTVLTTVKGARRLGGNAQGLAPWGETVVSGEDGTRVRVVATPARHGPPLSRPFVGDVIGFLLEWEGQRHGSLYLSGDTVWFRGVAEVAQRFTVGTAILNVGAAGFRNTGPIRYTFNGREAARAARALGAHTVIPSHYDGWSHFREQRETTARAFEDAGLGERVRWLPQGEGSEIEV